MWKERCGGGKRRRQKFRSRRRRPGGYLYPVIQMFLMFFQVVCQIFETINSFQHYLAIWTCLIQSESPLKLPTGK